jgi:hypothetical protein
VAARDFSAALAAKLAQHGNQRQPYGDLYGEHLDLSTSQISGCSRAVPGEHWWALKDSNLRPTD